MLNWFSYSKGEMLRRWGHKKNQYVHRKYEDRDQGSDQQIEVRFIYS